MHTRWKLLIASLLLLGWLGSARAENPQASNHNILVIGDSLSAEYGIRRDSGWVRIIQQRLQQEAAGYTMRNASISGDTTSGGLSRMPAALERYRPAIVVIELGSNDALRGLPLDMTRGNLARMIALAKEHETGFVPFLLEGVALDRTLFQDDGMHPNEAAQPLIADNVWAVLGPMVAG